MELHTLAPNRTELHIGHPKTIIFFSYNTPVAVYTYADGKYYRTEQRYSVTTSKHITQWLNGNEAETKPQSFFDSLVKG